MQGIGSDIAGNSGSLGEFGVYPQLEALYLGKNTSSLSDERIIMIASIFPNLQLLDLNSCNRISEGICQVLRRCCKIKHLNLAYCSRVKLLGMNFVVPNISPPHSTPLPSYTTITPLISTSPSVPLHNSRPHRNKHAPFHLKDYVCNSSTESLVPNSSGTSYPISHSHTFEFLSPSHKLFSVSLTNTTEPKTYVEACKSPAWITAMNTELDALSKNQTWTLVDLPPHIKPIGCKWSGYSLPSIYSWHIHQLDVNNAFLHGELQEAVYMLVPEGVTCAKPNQVCKLKNSLYGLKQASKKLYEKLSTLLIHEGYSQSSSDYSLFTMKNGLVFIVILVYIDDIIVTGTSMIEINRIKNILDLNFKIKDLGILKYFLGSEVAHSKQGITISQRKYCLDLLQDTGLLGSKLVSTPLDPSIKLHQDT
ncbi:unnamed protein product [Trifolium pratense]|uniref:Uncharacterized protein n=1 Tax=Trifolium pratense TaxID=57577 RepID=A0ACB0LBL0_TRIPR|nr:unnamed protein product [Trifolium pratense]